VNVGSGAASAASQGAQAVAHHTVAALDATATVFGARPREHKQPAAPLAEAPETAPEAAA